MPCSDGGPNYSDYVRVEDERNKLNALLCEACGIVDDAKLKTNMSKNLRAWWKKHQREDAERRKREEEKRTLKRLADTAISKLSTEEIEALREAHGLRFTTQKQKRRSK